MNCRHLKACLAPDRYIMARTYHTATILVLVAVCNLSSCFEKNELRDELLLKIVGCFEEGHEYRNFPYNITDSDQAFTANSCIDICLRKYYRYAILKDEHNCYCNSSYGVYSPIGCRSEACGNVSDVLKCVTDLPDVVFDTGQKAPGPPLSLRLFNATETSIQVVWSPPLVTNGDILGYRIVANAVSTFFQSDPLTPREWNLPNTTFKNELPDLHAGTKYKVSVGAHSKEGVGVELSDMIWTEIGDPEEPEVPKIVKRDKGQVTVHLKNATNSNGPITAYRIVVLYEDGGHTIEKNMLKSFQEAEREGLSYYIAAELDPEDMKDEFIVGDGRMYGKYYNPPLPPSRYVHITLGIVSSLNNITKVTYAKVSHDENDVLILDVGDNMQESGGASPGMVIALSVAIGICGFLLVLSVIAYLLLRRRLGRRRLGSDHQELSLQGPMVEVEPNGYIHSGYIPEEQEERVNHYENLKRQVWNIPRNFLDVRSEMLGRGRYGNVMRGTVQQRGFPIPVAIYTIADGELPPDEKRSMLKDLGVLIRVSSNANVASLVGTCESPDTLFVVIEYHPASLKDILLESRCLEHSVSPFSVQTSMLDSSRTRQRMCSLPETQVLETAIGIARAMDYLTSEKIIHTKLAARSVLMADGVVPKVTGCGISMYNKLKENPDFTRWTAQEIFRGRTHVSKSDVWSFGCVLWEITAIGATPYADVATCDVAGRVTRGQRLPQFQYVDDDLYQLMLQCWQTDLDERPTFQEIIHILENMLDDCTIHLNFEMFAGFHYEPYVQELEQCQP